jgi:hypothetical protein
LSNWFQDVIISLFPSPQSTKNEYVPLLTNGNDIVSKSFVVTHTLSNVDGNVGVTVGVTVFVGVGVNVGHGLFASLQVIQSTYEDE